MMGLAAGALSWIFGNGLKAFTVPLLIGALIVAAHQLVQAHDKRVTATCDARWEADIRQEERDAAKRQARAAMSILESERQTNEELRDELEQVRKDADTLRGSLSGADERCLSNGVLDALRKKR